MDSLLDEITLSATKIKYWLKANDLPQPSLDRSTPAKPVPPNAPEEIQVARQKLIEASHKLNQIALGPSEYIPNLAVGAQYVACLRWLCRFNAFTAIPLEGTIAYSELAQTTGAPEAVLKSVARMAMTGGLLCEPEPGQVAHSAVSALFITNPNFLLWAEFMTECSAPTAARFVDATQKWPGSANKTETAYNLAFDTDLPFFDHLATIPKRTEQFAGYMKSVTSSEGTDLKHLVSGYDWASLGKATVVDVGGSSGHASIALAKAFPELSFIVQDLPTNVEDGRASVAANYPELTSRIDFQAYNFFEQQPVRDADVYFLRMIIHDWPDSEAAVILRNTVQSMKPGARLVIMDTALPAPGSVPATVERLLRLRDLTMMQAFNSKERSPEDWDALLAAVDSRFKLVRTRKPFGSVLSIMEWVVDEAEEHKEPDSVEFSAVEHVQSSAKVIGDGVGLKVEEVVAGAVVAA